MELNFENYTKLKELKLTRAKIADEFGITENRLKKHISKEGWSKPRPKIRNTDCFDTINADSAYWAGYIAADGCVSDNGTLYLCINYDDTEQLVRLRTFLGSDHSIGSNTSLYYRSTFGVKLPDNMITSLETIYGITPRKSLTYKYPSELVSSKYYRDFIRGYFDGDGCICESFSNKDSITATLYATIVGSKDFIEQLSVDLKIIIPEASFSIQEKSTTKTIKFCTKSSFIFFDYIYGTAIDNYLDRKFRKYRDILINGRKSR